VVHPGQGIKVHYLSYWNEVFRHPDVEHTPVPIRYDPFDISVAYAYVRGRWSNVFLPTMDSCADTLSESSS
jgi:putative transposase